MQFQCLHLKKGIADLEKGNVNKDGRKTVLLDVQQVRTISFRRKTPWEEHDLSLQKQKSSDKVKELLLQAKSCNLRTKWHSLKQYKVSLKIKGGDFGQ